MGSLLRGGGRRLGVDTALVGISRVVAVGFVTVVDGDVAVERGGSGWTEGA